MQELRDYYLTFLPAALEGSLFLQLLSIFILSLIPFIESYGAIPFGLIMFGIPIIPVFLTAVVGNWISVMAFIWIISKLRSKVKSKKKVKEPSKRALKARRYFEKYGVPGVSLAGILIGYHIAAGIPLAAKANKSYVSLWITISIILWSVVIGILAVSGVNLLS